VTDTPSPHSGSTADSRPGSVAWGPRGRVLASLALATIVAGALFVLKRGQDINWDLQNYHFYSGFSILHGRLDMGIAPVGLQSFLNPMLEAPVYLLFRMPYPVGPLVVFLIQWACVPVLYLIARRLLSGMSGRSSFSAMYLALVLTLLSPLWLSELGTSFSSSWTASLVLAGLLMILKPKWTDEASLWSLGAAGVFLGIASGLKLVNAPYALTLGVCVVVVELSGGAKATLKAALSYAAGLALGILPCAWWYVSLWRHYGSPLFPYYNALFASPLFPLLNWRDDRWKLDSVRDVGSYVWGTWTGTSISSEVAFGDRRLILLLVLFAVLVLAALLRRVRVRLAPSALILVLFFGLSYLVWAAVFAYQRYLIPIELLTGLVLWVIVSVLFRSRRLQVAVLCLLVAIAALGIQVPDWGHRKVRIGSTDPFAMRSIGELSQTPALYIVATGPLGFAYPYLHPDSRFYSLGVSSALDDAIYRQVADLSTNLPIRIISAEGDTATAPAVLARLRALGVNGELYCREVAFGPGLRGSGLQRVCEIR